MKQTRLIGILEDDETLGTELKYYLETNGYEVRLFDKSEYAGQGFPFVVKMLMDENLHMLLLDIGLPGLDGLHVCKLFRRETEVPVIMITSKNNELTELIAIENGADDFVAKPFNPQILLAHMETVLRRVYKEGQSSDSIRIVQKRQDGDGAQITQEFQFKVTKGRINNGGKSMELSKNEIQMLKILAVHQGEIVSRDEIMNALWDDCMFVDDNTLTVNMTRLKGKLEDIGISGAILTKRGMGYQLL